MNSIMTARCISTSFNSRWCAGDMSSFTDSQARQRRSSRMYALLRHTKHEHPTTQACHALVSTVPHNDASCCRTMMN